MPDRNYNLTPANRQQPVCWRDLRLWIFLGILWCFQVRFPPLSYPALGLPTGLLLAGLVLLCGVWWLQSKPSGAVLQAEPMVGKAALRCSGGQITATAGLVAGVGFVLWAGVRWLLAGMSYSGVAELGTIFWASLYFLATWSLLLQAGVIVQGHRPTESGCGLASPGEDRPMLLPQLRTVIWIVALLGGICAAYAIWQYYVGYDQAWQALSKSIGSRAPDRTEEALLHHLSLRRVASYWGDPNSYACFAAIGIAAALEIATWRRGLLRVMCAGLVVAGGAGIYYTGSRGGVLDLIIVILIYTIVMGRQKLHAGRRPHRAVVFAGVFALSGLLAVSKAQVASPQGDPAGAAFQEPGWTWRSDTIRERIFYLEVGEKMIREAPWLGLGLGSVDLYFGRFKDPRAREARQLHNWPANTWAELGLIGLGLVVIFLAAVAVQAIRHKAWERPGQRFFLVTVVVLVFDGLLQTSWAERELMCLMGVGCAILLAGDPARYSNWLSSGVNDARPKSWRLRAAVAGLCLCGGSIFLAFEIPAMLANSSKQIARDATLGGDFFTAEKAWQKASRWMPKDPEPYQAQAGLALQAGRPELSERLLHVALHVAPQSAALNSQLAGVQMQLGKTAEAKKRLERALQLYPSNPDYCLQYAQFLKDTGDAGQALQYARKALEYSYLEPDIAAAKALIQTLETVPAGVQK